MSLVDQCGGAFCLLCGGWGEKDAGRMEDMKVDKTIRSHQKVATRLCIYILGKKCTRDDFSHVRSAVFDCFLVCPPSSFISPRKNSPGSTRTSTPFLFGRTEVAGEKETETTKKQQFHQQITFMK